MKRRKPCRACGSTDRRQPSYGAGLCWRCLYERHPEFVEFKGASDSLWSTRREESGTLWGVK